MNKMANKTTLIRNHAAALCVFVFSFFLLAGSAVFHETYAVEYESLIPGQYQDAVCDACGVDSIESITDAEVGEVRELSLTTDGNEPLDFLSMFSHLEALDLTVETDDDKDCLSTVPSIPSLKALTIEAKEDLEISSAANNQIFQTNSTNIKTLTLNGVDLGPDTVEYLKNLTTLTLKKSLNQEIDYEALSLQTLDLSWYGPYDVPIFMTYDDYQGMVERGIEVRFSPEHIKNEYIQVWEKIERIVNELNIENSGEEEILAAAAAYTIDHLNPVHISENNGETSNDEAAEFCKDGNLYAVFNKNSATCSNYTALLKALLEAANVESFYIINDTDEWNLVMVDGKLGYVDAFALDDGETVTADTIRNGQGRGLGWYMQEVEDAPTIGPDERQRPSVIPKYLVEKAEKTTSVNTEPQQPETETVPETHSEEKKGFPALPVLLLVIVAAAGCAAIIVGRRRKKTVQSTPKQSSPSAEGTLYWTRRKKHAALGTELCAIGSSESEVNLYVPNSAISRVHAVIQWTEYGYMIRDMNSTNGTYVNDQRIGSEKFLLRTGDVIRLADEEFVFRTDKKMDGAHSEAD